MAFFIGQRVRLLHHSGEGVVLRQIDKETLEVDLGDDFPIDVHIDEVVPVDKREEILAPVQAAESTKETKDTVRKMGLGVYELCLLVTDKPNSNQMGASNAGYRVHIINPEGTDALYVVYAKINHKYTSIGRGMVPSGEVKTLCDLTRDQINHIREWYVQFLLYKEGNSYPQEPLTQHLKWSQASLMGKRRHLPALDAEALIFPLRKHEDEAVADVATTSGAEYIVRKGLDAELVREERVVDLHIEALVANPSGMKPQEMLDLQMQRVHTLLDEALRHNFAKIIFIHGVGDGVLRKEVQKRLRQTQHVKTFAPAEQQLYGNGATEVIFK
jgi:hypothetical protein